MSLILLWLGCTTSTEGLSDVSPEARIVTTITVDGEQRYDDIAMAHLYTVVPVDGCIEASWLVLRSRFIGQELQSKLLFPAPLADGAVAASPTLPFAWPAPLPVLTFQDRDPQTGADGDFFVTSGGTATFSADSAWSSFGLVFEGASLCPAGSSVDSLDLDPSPCAPADIEIAFTGNIRDQGYCTDGFGGAGQLCAPVEPDLSSDTLWHCDLGPEHPVGPISTN